MVLVTLTLLLFLYKRAGYRSFMETVFLFCWRLLFPLHCNSAGQCALLKQNYTCPVALTLDLLLKTDKLNEHQCLLWLIQ